MSVLLRGSAVIETRWLVSEPALAAGVFSPKILANTAASSVAEPCFTGMMIGSNALG